MTGVNKIGLVVMTILLIIGAFVVFTTPPKASITGYVVGGGTQASGEQQTGNPTQGIIKGYVSYTISDNGVIVNTEAPSSALTVYFVTQGEIIDWDAAISCPDPIQGTITNADADDSGSSCSQNNYATPTAYACSASLSGGSGTTIYKTTTSIVSDNEGCFASKLPAGNFDIYV